VDSRVTTERFVEAGDQIVQIGRTQGQVRAQERRSTEVHVWTLRQGKIVRFEAYTDHPTMLPALR
jgi:hypothetical protein